MRYVFAAVVGCLGVANLSSGIRRADPLSVVVGLVNIAGAAYLAETAERRRAVAKVAARIRNGRRSGR